MLRITDFLTIPPKRGPLWTPVARKLWGSEAVRRATNATLIVAMLVSPSIATALVRGPALTDEQVAEAIAAVAEAPFDSTPLRLRRSAAEILLPISVPHPQPKEQEHVLPRAMVDRLVADNAELFVDEGRIQDSSVLSHDWELVKRLVRLIRDRATSQEAQIRSLDGLTLLLRADRYMTGLAVRDARTVLDAAIDGDGLSANDLKKARAHMNTAELRLRNGIDALERGDGDGAVEHFLKAYEFAAAVLAVWHIDYRGDLDGDEVVDLVEMRIGSSVFLEDTDGDGLSDAYEVENTIPHTMPDAADTDEDDLPDGEEDLDEDLLTNAMERDLGTDPLEPDTDDDGLPDSAEAAQPGLDPLEADTDGDGLTDESELRLGTDPGNEDSDGDDIEDGDETHLQIVELPGLDVVVELEGVGDHSRSLRGQSLADAPLFSEVPGLVAPFVALGDTLLFERAAISGRLAMSDFTARAVGRHRPVPPNERPKRPSHLATQARTFFEEIARFRWIGLDIVELGNREIDELVGVVIEPREGRPVPVQVERKRLEIGVPVLRELGIDDERKERLALAALGRGDACELGRRGSHIDEAHSRGDAPARRQHAGPPQKEGNVKRGLVSEHAVRLLAMIP